MKPNYQKLGFSDWMGPKLRAEVERQLLLDLKHYITTEKELFFDWSESCIEGKRIKYLDGEVENFSGISLYDSEDEPILEGWMNFYFKEETNTFIVYWDCLDDLRSGIEIELKDFGIPEHVKKQIM